MRPAEFFVAGARLRCAAVLYGAVALALHLAILLFIVERRQASDLCALVFALLVLATVSGLVRLGVFLVLVVRRRHRRWLAPLGPEIGRAHV